MYIDKKYSWCMHVKSLIRIKSKLSLDIESRMIISNAARVLICVESNVPMSV